MEIKLFSRKMSRFYFKSNLNTFQGVKQVLVKLGAKGSALFVEGEEPIRQPMIPAAQVLDTTGAGDTFTASFAVALVEGKSKEECMRFAGTASSHSFNFLYI